MYQDTKEEKKHASSEWQGELNCRRLCRCCVFSFIILFHLNGTAEKLRWLGWTCKRSDEVGYMSSTPLVLSLHKVQKKNANFEPDFIYNSPHTTSPGAKGSKNPRWAWARAMVTKKFCCRHSALLLFSPGREAEKKLLLVRTTSIFFREGEYRVHASLLEYYFHPERDGSKKCDSRSLALALLFHES